MTYVRPTGNVILRFVLEPRRVTAILLLADDGAVASGADRSASKNRSGAARAEGSATPRSRERAETGGQGGATAEPRTGDAYTVHAGDPDRPVCGSKSSSNKRAARRESSTRR